MYEYKTQLQGLAPQIMKDAGVLIDRTATNTNEQVKKFMDVISPYVKGIFGEVEGTERKGGEQMPTSLGRRTNNYSILSKSYDNPALTDLMSRATPGGLAVSPTITINNPSISYSPTINPQLQGVNTPQELMELINKGGVQLSEQMARALYDSLKKLDILKLTP